MKACFTFKPSPREIYPQDEFAIEKAVRLSPEEFADLLENPLKDRAWIAENRRLMWRDEKKIWHCIFAVAEGYDYGILIQSDGSAYPRYAAYLPTAVFDLR